MKVKKAWLPLLLAACCLGNSGSMSAQDRQSVSRPISSRYTLEAGRRHSLCTYLSPLVYTGLDLALGGTWRKTTGFSPDWEMEFNGKLDFSNAKSPSKNSTMLSFDLGFAWGMERVWSLPNGLKAGFGARASADGGVLYLGRNSNNPANALARVGVDLTCSASYPFSVGKLNMSVFERAVLPTAGVFFCPQYGEPYYEIYLGNCKGLLHAGWWGNNFGFDNLLGVEMKFGRKSLVLGWRYELQTIHAENIDTQLWRHAGVVGIKF